MSARAAALAAWLAASTALAQYNYLPFKMLNSQADPFKYHVDGRAPNPAGLSLSSATAATNAAWNTWDTLSCSSLAFQFQGNAAPPAVPDVEDAYDSFNVSTIWLTNTSDPYYKEMFAVDIAAQSITLAYAGVLLNCDIYLTAVTKQWSTAASTPSTAADLQTVILHESGHCQGLDHNLDLAHQNEDVMAATIAVGEQKRTLSQRDIDGICLRYPSKDAVGSPCLADGGCGTVNTALKCVKAPRPDGGTTPPFCTIGCPTGQNFKCNEPYLCQSSAAFSPTFNGACLPPTIGVTLVGAPCVDANQCGASVALCVKQGSLPSGAPAWQDGYCTQTCGVGQTPCPTGSECIDVAGDGSLLRCLKKCRMGSGDCRFAYSCSFGPKAEASVCVPSCASDLDCNDTGTSGNQCRVCDGNCLDRQNPTGQIGDFCTNSGQCGLGQSCVKFDPFTVGICTQACALACTACPNGSSCHAIGTRGELFCFRNCQAGTCGQGKQCGYLNTGRGCLPGCTGDTQCAVGTFCSQTGECMPPPQQEDSGCPLCPEPGFDAGIIQFKDAGQGGGSGSGGCGCSSGGEAFALAAAALLLALLAVRKERAWRPH